MMKPARFLEGFDTILFDLDGVITSERTYWDCAALSCTELAFDKRYFGTRDLDLEKMAQHVNEISERVFCGDDTIVLLKNRGVNTNWDLAWLMFAGIMGLGCGDDFRAVYEHYEQTDLRVPDLYTHAEELLRKVLPGKDCSRLGEVWTMVQVALNEWYCGSEEFRKIFGYEASHAKKEPMMRGEKPLHPIEKTQVLLKTLHNAGIRLGVGTGRPREEFRRPAETWDILQYFDPTLCVTYDELTEVQKKFQHVSLAKPHPYTFAKAVLGDSCSDFDLTRGSYDKKPMERVLVVGDAAADLFAAKEMGAKFAAVLTGVNGKDSKKFFEVQGADFILNSVLDFVTE